MFRMRGTFLYVFNISYIFVFETDNKYRLYGIF